MTFDGAAVVRTLADGLPSPDQSSGVIIALIGATGTLLGTVLAAWLTYKSRVTGPRPVPLNSDNTGDPDVDHDSALAARVAVLERFLFLNHYDPNRIDTGEESGADVHFD